MAAIAEGQEIKEILKKYPFTIAAVCEPTVTINYKWNKERPELMFDFGEEQNFRQLI